MRDCVHRDDAKTPARFVVDDRRRLNRTKCYASTQYDRLHDQLADVIEFNLTLSIPPHVCVFNSSVFGFISIHRSAHYRILYFSKWH